MTRELILIRHGVTAWNKERRFQGGIDIPLDEEGWAQARALGRYFRTQPAPDLILSSHLERARHTATPIAEAFGLPLQIDPAWCERQYGEFEGKSHEELERSYPEAFARWRARDLEFELPGGGESIARFHLRVKDALNSARARFTGDVRRIVIVTHGGVLGAVYRIALDLAPDNPIKIPIENTGVNRLWLDGEGSSAAWRVHSWGELLHLTPG